MVRVYWSNYKTIVGPLLQVNSWCRYKFISGPNMLYMSGPDVNSWETTLCGPCQKISPSQKKSKSLKSSDQEQPRTCTRYFCWGRRHFEQILTIMCTYNRNPHRHQNHPLVFLGSSFTTLSKIYLCFSASNLSLQGLGLWKQTLFGVPNEASVGPMHTVWATSPDLNPPFFLSFGLFGCHEGVLLGGLWLLICMSGV